MLKDTKVILVVKMKIRCKISPNPKRIPCDTPRGKTCMATGTAGITSRTVSSARVPLTHDRTNDTEIRTHGET